MLRGNVRAHEMLLERHAGRIIAAAQPSAATGDDESTGYERSANPLIGRP